MAAFLKNFGWVAESVSMVVHSCAYSLDPRPSMLDERRSSGQLFRCKPYGWRKVPLVESSIPDPKTATLTKDFNLLRGIMHGRGSGSRPFANSGSSVGSAGKEL
jgi:hypothetical protein